MKKSLITLVLLTLAIAVFGNGISLNSIGPKAGAMGGAFIGQADDATAVYWNPAGLVGQEATITASMVDVYLFPTYKYDAAGIDAKVEDFHLITPHIFTNYSKDRFAWGFGLFVPHGLGVEWDGADLLALSGPSATEFNWSSEISMITASSSAAYQVTDKFNVGFTVNIHHGSMTIERGEDRFDAVNSVMGTDGAVDTQYKEELSGSGTSFGFGLQFNPIEDLTIGLSYRSPSVVALSGDAELKGDIFSSDLYVRRDFELPFWIGLGTSWRATDKWTFNLDGQLTRWSTYDKMVSQIIMPTATENVLTHMEWDDALQIRVGTEYKATDAVALRAGYFYDPAPAPDETTNILFPSSTNHNATIGSGYTYRNFTVDLALEYYFGEEREVEPATHNMPGVHQMDLFAYILGITYTF